MPIPLPCGHRWHHWHHCILAPTHGALLFWVICWNWAHRHQLYHDQLLPHLTSIDVVHAIGDHMTKLYHQLPSHQQGIAAHSIAQAQRDIIASLHHGDVLMVKGSAGVRLASFVKKLHEHNGEPHAV